MIRQRICTAHSLKTGRRGMSLLEVFIALAIFIAALAVITQIISTGSRASTKAQLQSEATLRAESCMAEAIAGVIPLQNEVNGLATLKRIIRDPQIYLDAAGSTSNDNALDLLK
jgi:type II secretory pathway pseudopilin PulG